MISPNPSRKSGILTLFFYTMFERFAYYGMRSIIVLYFIDENGLALENTDALHYYGVLTMSLAIAFIPMGFLSDFVFKQKRAIEIGGSMATLGYLMLSLENMPFFITGLVLIVLGLALLKPNIPVLLGGMFDRNDQKRDAAFMTYYIGVNLGAFLSALIVATIANKYGWSVGFQTAGAIMFAAVIIFAIGKKSIVQIDVDELKQPADIDPVAFKNDLSRKNSNRLGLAFLAMALSVIFWQGFEITTSQSFYEIRTILTDEALKQVPLFGLIPMSQSLLQSFNALFIIPFGVILILVFYTQRISTPIKFGISFILIALSTWVLVPIFKGPLETISVVELLIASYFFAALAELFISPIVQSYITRLVPNRISTTFMAVYFFVSQIIMKISGLYYDDIAAIPLEQLLTKAAIIFIIIGLVIIALNKSLIRAGEGVN